MAENNPFPGENNTGHIWDDNIRELDNPIPRWWMIGFYISLLWVIGYAILYPTIPSAKDYTKGVMGWTSQGEMADSLKQVEDIRAPFEDKISSMSAAEILEDEGLAAYAEKSARVLFGDNCAACHGSGGQGAKTFPVLADDDWLYGGKIETLVQTITNGRQGMMTAIPMTESEATKLAEAIVAGNVTEEPLFKTKSCFACHGMDAKGIQAIGSVNLTDSIYRFADDDQLASVKQTIMHGVNFKADPETRIAEMPSFKKRLSESEIKKLAVYVHRLGGGQ